MLNFSSVSQSEFLQNYWQKKPLLIKKALPNFQNIVSADELAGLAMEEDFESKVIFKTPTTAPFWHLKRGPFKEADFSKWPQTHWTLLVQGVDRFIPEVSHLLDSFNFLPQWRVDDVMISVAGLHGSVGPHYDNYDVFLYQAEGKRKWFLTTQHCHESNVLPDLELRIMKDFQVEQEIVLNEGDMLYLPPHVGHHGVSLTDNSISYSFGYRSYQSQELWDSYADHLSETKDNTHLYQDPNWNNLKNTSELNSGAIQQAKNLMIDLLSDETKLTQWFGRFATQLDQGAAELLEAPLDSSFSENEFILEYQQAKHIERCLVSRFAYHYRADKRIELFINGDIYDHGNSDDELISLIADNRMIETKTIAPYLTNKANKANKAFIVKLWREGLLHF